jgi:iron complex outermembrane receptor protein
LRLQSALIHSLLLAGLATSTQARAQSDASIEEASQTFQLGTVDVRDNRDAVSGDEQRLGASEMRLRNADTVADAVRQLPGATLSRNSRNEEMIYLRGFDPRQVPVFVEACRCTCPMTAMWTSAASPPSTCPRSAWPRPAPR